MNERNDTHQRILDVATELFATRGYKAVRIRELADTLGIKHTALYYYVKNKEDLYVQVMQDNLAKHRAGMEDAIDNANGDIRDALIAVGKWLLAQPHFNMMRMMETDLGEIAPENATKLSKMAFDTLRMPVANALSDAQAKGIVSVTNPELAAISFVTLIQTIGVLQANVQPIHVSVNQIVEETVDMLLNGFLSR
ncbi:MAG: TetR/AcrR family transcriptional regulator [Chloroflexota bacterium]